MAYSLQIERSEPIKVDELLRVVETIDYLQIDASDLIGKNPSTGEEIRIPGAKTDIALWFSETNEWIKVFYFRQGRIVFNAKEWDTPNSPIRDKAFEIAQKLNAEIIGDNGEIYTE